MAHCKIKIEVKIELRSAAGSAISRRFLCGGRQENARLCGGQRENARREPPRPF
jgi:hypothetical protein